MLSIELWVGAYLEMLSQAYRGNHWTPHGNQVRFSRCYWNFKSFTFTMRLTPSPTFALKKITKDLHWKNEPKICTEKNALEKMHWKKCTEKGQLKKGTEKKALKKRHWKRALKKGTEKRSLKKGTEFCTDCTEVSPCTKDTSKTMGGGRIHHSHTYNEWF